MAGKREEAEDIVTKRLHERHDSRRRPVLPGVVATILVPALDTRPWRLWHPPMTAGFPARKRGGEDPAAFRLTKPEPSGPRSVR